MDYYKYKGYSIKREKHYFVVTSPDGVEWVEDSVEDAKRTIDNEESDEKNEN